MSDNIIDINGKAEGAARAASKQGTFNFLDRLAGRNYPREKVTIFLDEALGYRVQAKVDELSNEKDADRAEALGDEIGALIEELNSASYTVHLEGISVEEYDATVDSADEQFPLEFTTEQNPLTFAREKIVVPNPEREQYFRTLLWSKYIRSVETSSGEVDDNITQEWVAVFLNRAPVMAQIRLSAAIDALRMTTDWMDAIQTDDFFRKS